jgi:hypothetical protein
VVYSERDLPVICRIAEQKLSFEVHSFKLQLDYGVRKTEAILGFWKYKIRTYFLVKIQLSEVPYRPGLCIYGKRVVDTFPPTDRLTQSMTVMTIKRRPSHSDQASIQIFS